MTTRHKTSRLGRALHARRTQTISLLVQEEIESMIMSGALKGGERLNETVLADDFGVSRGPIREALRGLEKTGLIRILPNRGVFVRTLGVEEALELYDLRAALFGLAGRLVAASIDSDGLAVIRDLVEQMSAAVAAGDIDAYYPLNVKLHTRLVEYSGNAHLIALFPTVDKQLHLFRRQGLIQAGQMRHSNEEHKELLVALTERDEQRAAAVCEQHILAGKSRLLASLEEQRQTDMAWTDARLLDE